MKYTNAFFRLDIRENGVYVHIYPEKDGGKKNNLRRKDTLVIYLAILYGYFFQKSRG